MIRLLKDQAVEYQESDLYCVGDVRESTVPCLKLLGRLRVYSSGWTIYGCFMPVHFQYVSQ